MDLPVAATLYCIGLAIVFLGLWIYYDRRDHLLFEHGRRKSTFCCVRCTQLYAREGAPELAKCPRCGHENARLRF